MADVRPHPGSQRIESAAPLVVSLAVGGAVAVWMAVTLPDVGPWAWSAAVAPVAIHGVDLVRARRHRRGGRRRVPSGKSLRRADLARADLANRILRHRDLSRSRIVDADLSGADLTRADLTEAKLHRSDLSGAKLARADCEGAVFYRACLAGADLDGVQASDASFEQADLRGASLVRADLRGADLSGADVRGADFSRALMRPDALDGAVVDATTTLGDGRRGRAAEVATDVGWRSLLAAAGGVAAWQLVRPVLLGLVGAATVAGTTVGGGLSDDAPGSVEVASATERASGDHSEVLETFGVTQDRRPIDIEPSADASVDASVDGATDQGAGAGPGGRSSTTPAATIAEPTVGRSPVPTSERGADEAGGADGADDELDEAPGPEVLGLTVGRGLQVVMDSTGGISTADFDSPIGSTTLTIYEEQRYDFDAAPPGPVTIVVTPSGADVVSSCTILADGVAETVEGRPGQPVTCAVTVAVD